MVRITPPDGTNRGIRKEKEKNQDEKEIERVMKPKVSMRESVQDQVKKTRPHLYKAKDADQ